MARNTLPITGPWHEGPGSAQADLASDDVDCVPRDDPEMPKRPRAWSRFLVIDSGLGIVGNIVTTLLTCLLAFALLTPRGLVPEGWNIAVVQAEFFAARWGEAGRALFLVIAAAFMADTWLSTADAVARVASPALPTQRLRSPTWSCADARFVTAGLEDA